MAYETGLRKPELGKLISGNTKPTIWHCLKKSSASFNRDSFVYRSAGYLKKCADGKITKTLGLAMAEGVSSASGCAKIPVLVATDDVLFSIPIDGSAAASKVLSQADMGAGYHIKASSGACTVVDFASSVASAATIQLERDGVDEQIGDTNPRVLVTLDRAIREVK